MRVLLCILLALSWAGAAWAQRRGTARPPPVRVERPASPFDRAAFAEESEAERLRRAAARAAAEGYRAADVLAAYERDAAGNWFKRAEIVVVGAGPALAANAARLGLAEVRRSALRAVNSDIVTYAAAPGVDTRAALAALRIAHPEARIDLNYVYSPQGQTGGAPPRPDAALARVGRLSVALVDGAVPMDNAAFARVAFSARRFATGASAGGEHAAAVAAILARAASAAELRIVAADVVSAGPIEGALAEDIARALDWAAQEGAGVINVSLTGPPSATLAFVADALAARGHIIVAAAGNGGPRAAAPYPAAVASVVAVTAVDERGRVWRRATRGPHVDFAAPGVRVAPFEGGARLTGTSYAAPVVAGALARLLPSPDPARAARAQAELAARARDLGAPGRDNAFGFGVIEAP